jgi:hypothetical protein
MRGREREEGEDARAEEEGANEDLELSEGSKERGGGPDSGDSRGSTAEEWERGQPGKRDGEVASR